jgi:hypothetical protein
VPAWNGSTPNSVTPEKFKMRYNARFTSINDYIVSGTTQEYPDIHDFPRISTGYDNSSPVGVITPTQIGQTFIKTSAPQAVYTATGLTSTNWLQTSISASNTYFNAETFSNGQILGDGTLRTLASLGYTNGSAATAWPRVAADVRFTINVSTMSIDWIAHQEAMLAMEQNGFNGFTAPGGRGYCFNQTCLLPRDQIPVPFFTRSQMFEFNFNGSSFVNLTGNNFIFFDKYPVDQTDANGLRLVYQYFFSNARFYGNNSFNSADCFIRLGGTSASRFENITGTEMGILIDCQFCLQVNFFNINVGNFGVYGITAREGLWPGAGVNSSQSNNVTCGKLHSNNQKNSIAPFYANGNRNISIYDSVFEGFSGATYHIFYDQAVSGIYASTVKNALRIVNTDFEAAGASRAGIRVNGAAVSLVIDQFNVQTSPAVMPVLVEVGGSPFVIANHVTIMNQPSYNPGYKFRNSGGQSIWTVDNVLLNDNADFESTLNWATDFGGIVPIYYNYNPVPNGVVTKMNYKTCGLVVNNNIVANTLQNITGLEFPVKSGRRYYFKFIILFETAVNTTGARFSINGPAASRLAYKSSYTSGVNTAVVNETLNSYDSPATAAAGSAGSNNLAIIEGMIAMIDSGNIIGRFASEVSGSAVTVIAGSAVYWQEVYQ